MTHHDKYGFVTALREARLRPELDELVTGGDVSPAARRCAFFLAVAIGNCRLFAVEPGDHDGTLPVGVAAAASSDQLDLLRGWIDKADNLGQRWDEATSRIERDDLSASLLEARMNAWAAFVAIDEAALAASTRSIHVPADLEDRIGEVCELLDEFDISLQAEDEVLSTVCGLNLLDGWRTMLRDSPYVESGWPWWLDGRLEAVSERILAECREAGHGLRRPLTHAKVSRSAGSATTLTRGQFQSALNECYASAADQQQRTVGPVLAWDHPQHEFFAQLEFPSGVRLDRSQEVAVEFFYGEAQSDLHGDTASGFGSIRLGALDGKISTDGSAAKFKIDEILNQESDTLPLQVDGVQWQLRSTE